MTTAAPLETAAKAPEPNSLWRIAAHAQFVLEYADHTAFGSSVGSRAQREIARLAASSLHALKRSSVDAWPTIGAELFSASQLGGLFQTPSELRSEVLFPDAARVKPAALTLVGAANRRQRFELSAGLTAELAPRLADWFRGSAQPRSGPSKELWNALRDVGALVPGRASTKKAPRGATFVGHASVLIGDGSDAVLFDPFMVSASSEVPEYYQPFSAEELEASAIFVTHSHPDHFALESLLHFDPSVRIFVPCVERESLLSIDMRLRLAELGFSNVVPLPWYASVKVGKMTVTALPFLGEQPTTAERLHPDVVNQGNTYLVLSEQGSYAVLADSGTDSRGSSADLAARASARWGHADVVFGGYRGWSLYPLQYLATSVPQYLLFVPEHLKWVRQTIMNDVPALLDVAERWRATNVVPYADGGAPWYWELGLGPNLATGSGNAHIDPLPEGVAEHARKRATLAGRSLASPVRVRGLHPGETLAPHGAPGNFEIENHFDRVWPYRDGPAAANTLAGKRLLLRKLAKRELARLGLEVSSSEVQFLIDEHRRMNGMTRAAELQSWLSTAQLDARRFTELMYEWATVLKLQDHYCTDVAELNEQVRFETMGVWKNQLRGSR